MTHDLVFPWQGIELAGTLHLPDGQPPYPAALMLQGSGEADRDCGDYFPPIREAFLSRGIATFSFDKPGIGGSTGDWRNYGFDGRTEQAIAALELLRAHDALDATRVGVWGQSQGGWLVQMIAARLSDLPFAIANSGPAINGEQQDLYGCEHTMRAAGNSEDDITHGLALMDALHAAARRGDDYATVDRELLEPARGTPGFEYLSIDSEASWALICRFVGEQYEPIEALEQIRCPFLAIFGALDPLVPAWDSAQLTSQALATAGNRDAAVVVFPTGNHRIADVNTGEFVTGYLELLADWAARRVAPQ
jgi:uncharacterized protein